MATVVPFASCYSSTHNVQLFGRGARGGYLLFLSYRGPRYTPRPRLTGQHPKMTLRQICHMLKVMKQMRKQGSAAPAPVPTPPIRPDRKCVPSCLKRKRSVKRVSWPVCPPSDRRQTSRN